MFASLVQKDVTLKILDQAAVAFLGADEIVVTIQKLSGRSLEKARVQQTIEQAGPVLRSFGGDVVKSIRSETLDEAAKQLKLQTQSVEARKKAYYASFDRESVLIAAVRRWSCEDRKKLCPESLADLDEKSAQQLHVEIIELSAPFDASEAAEGKD
jgi:hypothetical protein